MGEKKKDPHAVALSKLLQGRVAKLKPLYFRSSSEVKLQRDSTCQVGQNQEKGHIPQ
jgi:hypothetical protein